MTPPASAQKELTPQLSDRYCEFLDILEEIDLVLVEERIAKLTRLRDRLRAMRGLPPADVLHLNGEIKVNLHVPATIPLSSKPEPPRPPVKTQTPAEPNKRPLGFWTHFLDEKLCKPLTVRELFDIVPNVKPSDYSTINSRLKDNPSLYVKVPGTNPIKWEKNPKAPPIRTTPADARISGGTPTLNRVLDIDTPWEELLRIRALPSRKPAGFWEAVVHQLMKENEPATVRELHENFANPTASEYTAIQKILTSYPDRYERVSDIKPVQWQCTGASTVELGEDHGNPTDDRRVD